MDALGTLALGEGGMEKSGCIGLGGGCEPGAKFGGKMLCEGTRLGADCWLLMGEPGALRKGGWLGG